MPGRGACRWAVGYLWAIWTPNHLRLAQEGAVSHGPRRFLETPVSTAGPFSYPPPESWSASDPDTPLAQPP